MPIVDFTLNTDTNTNICSTMHIKIQMVALRYTPSIASSGFCKMKYKYLSVIVSFIKVWVSWFLSCPACLFTLCHFW